MCCNPACSDVLGPERQHISAGHIIDVKYRGNWYRAEFFLTRKGHADGIYTIIASREETADDIRDKYTASLLNHMAAAENDTFRLGRNDGGITKFRVYWKNGRAVGCYTYLLPLEKRRKIQS